MGLRPPSDYGRSTVITNCENSGQVPLLSAAFMMFAKASKAVSDSRRSARGCIVSAPRPVVTGKVLQALRIIAAVMGLGLSLALG